MKEMIITATFKGQDGSLGYKTNREYKLKLTNNNKIINSRSRVYSKSLLTPPVHIEIQDMSNRPAGNCGYGSMIAFLQNWTNVKDVTAEEAKKPKRNQREVAIVAINFTDFCKGVMDGPRRNQALRFYNEEFKPEKVMYYFQNWSMEKSNHLYRNGVILTNNNTADWKVKVWINDGAEYTFCSGSDGTDSPEKNLTWINYPKTMSEFISDCLRHEDVELLLRPRAVKKIYG
jgi:hypothetical protein